jgi:regulator of protease activity HflC (stomatin/prohibitin superfamily)
LQNIDLVLRLLFRPEEGKLAFILDNLGRPSEYSDRVLPGLSNEVLKSTVAGYNAEQLVTQREKVSAEIRETLQKRCSEFNILLDDVSITDLNFTRDFA